MTRVGQFGDKISEVGAGVVGTQEVQDRFMLASAARYQAVDGIGSQNPILYHPGKVEMVPGTSGWMEIPNDNYARRTFTWAKFKIVGQSAEFMFFNTHMPHPHGQAADRNTHARIARDLLAKMDELQARSTPSVVVGDFNPFASAGASEGSFESNLVASGRFFKAYQGLGTTGGFAGLDKIFASSHWDSSNGADQGTGSSDHPAIAVDLTLR